jgi:hypothetical protein
MKFILNVDSLENTLLKGYIELACAEQAPQIYKPRKGVVNGNKDKFQEGELFFMNTIAGPLLKLLGYGHLFNLTGEQTAEQSAAQLMVLPEWIKKHNEEALVKSMKAQNENVNVTSMLINHPKLLLRRKQEDWPEGRTSYRFKNALRKKVTIIGKSAFDLSNVVMPAEAKKEKFVASEVNYKEVAEDHVSDDEQRKA